MLAMHGVYGPKEACMCKKGLNEAFGDQEGYSTLCCSVFDIGPLSPHPCAFTCICGNAIHYACDWVCGSREAYMCNKGLNEAFGGKLFNFMLFNF